MHSLIIPLGGRSSRYPNVRPKWLLTHPNHNTMLMESIKGLHYREYDKIYIVVLKEHLEKYQPKFNKMMNDINGGLSTKLVVVVLNEPTASQSETVYLAIKQQNITGQITIKDCDNYFRMHAQEGNFVATFQLNNEESLIPGNKSYVLIEESTNTIVNIVEKKIISDKFCCGAYGFQEAAKFCEVFEKLRTEITNKEIYISHIIFDMLLNGEIFTNVKTFDYQDWGELSDWLNYTKEFKTLFVDFDGVLVEAGSEYSYPFQKETKPIQANIDLINNLYNSGKCYIVITTSRWSSEVEVELTKLGVLYHKILLGLPHCQRIVINDFAPTNPYPSCSSINLVRNSDQLKDYL